MNDRYRDDDYEVDEYGQIHRPYTEPENDRSRYGYDPYDEPVKQTFCIIATTVYGNPHCSEVVALRHWRDTVLCRSFLGRQFIEFYYRYGRWGAKVINRVRPLKKVTRVFLDKFVNHLNQTRKGEDG